MLIGLYMLGFITCQWEVIHFQKSCYVLFEDYVTHSDSPYYFQCNSNFKLVYFCKCAFYCCDRVDVTVTGYDYVFLEPSSDFVKDKLSSLLRVEITQFFLSVP